MAITFPASPTNGQTFTSGNKTWQWDGTTWLAYGASLSPTVLKVDAANARVGVNNQSPAYALDVNGTVGGTQFLQGTDYLSPYQGFRNKAINGGFDIWQRGTSFSNPASGSYIADRANILYDGSGATRTISQGQFDPYVSGASITATPPTGTSPTYFLRYNQSVAGSSASYNILYINRTEDVRVLAGKTVTVSFYAKAAANLTIGGVYFEQVFGSGGSPSSNVYSTISGSTSVTTSWQRFSYTVAVPSASGKVIGSSANSSYTGIIMYLPINTTFTLDIWGLQVEEGSVATPFEQRPIGTELALCQRYYYTSGTVYSMAYMSMNTNQTGEMLTWAFPVTMRAVPTAVQNFVNGDNTVLANMFLYNNYLSIKVYPFNTGFGYGAFSYGFNVSAEL